MQYRQSCDSTILQSIFGHKDKDKGSDKDNQKDKGSGQDQDKCLNKDKGKGSDQDQDQGLPGFGEAGGGIESRHPPLSASQTSMSFSLSAINDSTDFLRR